MVPSDQCVDGCVSELLRAADVMCDFYHLVALQAQR